MDLNAYSWCPWWQLHSLMPRNLQTNQASEWLTLLEIAPVHHCGVIMGAMASQITSLTIVYSTVYSGADQRKHQSSASLAFVRGIHRWAVNSPHEWPVTRKMFPFDDVIMLSWLVISTESAVNSAIHFTKCTLVSPIRSEIPDIILSQDKRCAMCVNKFWMWLCWINISGIPSPCVEKYIASPRTSNHAGA